MGRKGGDEEGLGRAIVSMEFGEEGGFCGFWGGEFGLGCGLGEIIGTVSKGSPWSEVVAGTVGGGPILNGNIFSSKTISREI